ncbi:MAG: hypothetical protein AB7H86_04855 [Blastocatellales bacterium]
MKKSVVYMIAALMMVGSISLTGLAQGKKKSVDVTLSSDVMVNNTLVRKGDYRAKVDFETGEMSLIENGNVIATVKGQVVEREMKSRHTAISLKDVDGGRKLVGLMVQGERRALVLNDFSTTTTTAEEQ